MVLLWKYLRKYKKILFLSLFLAIINQSFSLLDPQIFRLIVDNYATKFNEIPRNDFFSGVLLLLIASVGVAFISRVAKNFQDYYVNTVTQRVGTDMYSKGVDHTFSLPYKIFEDQRSGEVLRKLQKAREDSQKLIDSFINIIFLSAVGLIFVIIYAFLVNWTLGITFLVMVPVLGIFLYVTSRKIKDAQKKIVIESASLAGSTTETLRNVQLVKSLGLEDQEIKRLNDVNEKVLHLELKKIKLIRFISFFQGTMINGMRAIILLLMLYLIFNAKISIGEFFTLFVYSFFIFSPLAQLGTVVVNYQEAKASNEQLDKILKIKPEKQSSTLEKLDKINSIEFQGVEFNYSEKKTSLKNINLKVNGGESAAFVGPSGSGKTTLVKLLVGLYKVKKGMILINHKNLNKINSDDFRRRIGLVSQDTQLFAGTIKENLLFVNPESTDEDCYEVLKLASAMSLFERSKEKLNTKIGEGGIKVSGGERQRLAIARALLRNPEILIFDEATSSLDSLTEKSITETIQKIIKARPNLIVILVAHRLSTIAHCKKIYVLEKGKIIERGTHHRLIKKKGLYSALWREQSAAGSRTQNLYTTKW